MSTMTLPPPTRKIIAPSPRKNSEKLSLEGAETTSDEDDDDDDPYTISTLSYDMENIPLMTATVQ